MKRIFAFVLCLTMLLSQMAMVAEASRAQELSDLQYLEENGITVEDGANVVFEGSPLGRSETPDRYSPSVPKFMPAALKNLGLMPREEEVEDAPPAYDVGDDIEPEDYEVYEKYEIYQAKFNKSKIMIFQVAGEDAASEYIYDTMDMPVEITPTVSPLWYTMPSLASPKYGYNYIRAEDVTLVGDKRPAKVEYYLDEATGIAVHLPDLPATRELRVAPVEATRAPMREVPGRVMGERTLLASFKVGVYSRDGATWSGEQETRVCFTLPEMPEIEQKGSYYAEVVDGQGNVEEITVYPYCWVNTLFVDMPLDREVFVYSVDYPDEDKTIFDMGEGLEMYLSERYDRMNADRPFKDVIDFSFSNPDVMDITPIYNDKGEVIDWMFIVTKPFHTLETFTLTFKEDTKNTRATTHNSTGVWGTSINISGDHYITANGKVDLKGNCTVTGTALIRIGGGGTSHKVSHLRIAKRITITGTLTVTIDTDCGGSSIYRWNSEDETIKDLYAPMLYVKDSGNLICIGGHNSAYAPTTDCRVKLSGNKMSVARALVYTSSSGVVRFYNTIICDAYNTRNDDGSSVDRLGGGLYMNNSGDDAYIDICDYVTFENCKAQKGGGIYIENGRINVTKRIEGKDSAEARGYFKSCNASDRGGAIYIKGGTKGRIDPNEDTYLYVGVDGTPNTANHGAGIYVVNGTFNGEGTIACRYNKATNHGGGLMVEGGTLTISGSQTMWVGYNTAKYGGGVDVYGSASVLSKTNDKSFSIYGNTASDRGGGVYLQAGKISVGDGFTVGQKDADGVEKGNYSNWGSGMCIWSGTFQFNGSINVQYNDKDGCTKGGGIYIYTGTITCNTGDELNVHHNRANYGGGIYIGGSTKISDPPQSDDDRTKKSITFNAGSSGTGGVDVYNNTGDNNGGGIMAENCTWTNGLYLLIRSNTTPGNGGGMYLNGWGNRVTFTSSKKLNVYSNTATGNGGGIANNCDMTISADEDCNVYSNTATGNGGGIYNNGNLTANRKFFIYSNTGQDGGGLYHNAGTLQLNVDWSIRTNTAKGNGGGIYSKSDFNMTKGSYVGSWAVAGDNLGNKAVNGAGIFLADKTFTVDGTLSMGHNIASSQGGGIYIQGGTFHQKSGTLKLGAHTYSTSTAVAGNEANAGGGLSMTGGTFKCEGTLIMNGNKAKTGNGGGILAENATSVSITGTGNEIKNNTAQAQGGAMRCYNTNTTVKNATIDNNTATNGHAGGLIVYRGDGADGTLTLENCNITNNKCLNSHGQGVNGNTTEDDDRGAGIYAQAINVSITGGSITGNTTPYGVGGGIYFNSAGKSMSISNCTISNNEAHDTNATNTTKAGYGGGIYAINGSKVTISGCTITGNKADDYGGGIYITSGVSELEIKGTTNIGASGAANTTGTKGGGIYTSCPKVGITGGSVSYNHSPTDGGGIYVVSGAVTLTSVTMDSNRAKWGGGIYMIAGSTTVDGGSIKNHTKQPDNTTATVDGAGVWMSGSTLTVQNGAKIESNTCSGNGAGIKMNSGTINIKGSSSIYKNHASTYGGGIYMIGGTVNMSDSATISTNTANASGGGICVHASSGTLAVSMSGTSSITGNKTTNTSGSGDGGGIWMNIGTLTMSGTSSITNNQAGRDGGGIQYSGGSITINNTPSISSNTAKGKGGGINAVVALSINGALTIGGSAAAKGNTATGSGGGIYAANTLTLTSVTVQYNKGVNGGGICATNDTSLSSTTVSNNSTTGDTNSHGGGIHFNNSAKTLTLNACTISGNTAKGSGGGIHISAGKLKTDGNSTNINNNTTECYGGGLFMATGTIELASTTQQDLNIKNNTAVYGGGMFFGESGGTITITSAAKSRLFAQNNTANSGGGVFISGCTVTSGAEFKLDNNHAVKDASGTYGNGGGIYLRTNGSHTGKLSVSVKPYIYNNDAANSGGGIFFNSGTLDFGTAGVTLHNNEATENGGGIYAAATLTLNGNCSVGYSDSSAWRGNAAKNGAGIYLHGVSLTLGGATVKCNRATLHGGGIYAEGASTIASANFGNVTHNEAGTKADGTLSGTGGSGGGVFLGGTSKMTIGSGSLNNNKARATTSYGNGAGIYVDTSAELTLAGGSVSTNQSIASSQSNAGTALGAGIYTLGTVKVTGDFTVNGNTTNRYGGGIYHKSGTITISSGKTLTVNGSNSAGQYGGGIVVNSGSITGAGNLTVSGNSATSGGGGILMDGSTANATVNVTGTVDISKNTTDGYGGGVCLTGSKASFAPTGTMSIYENSAKTHGGGVYVSNGSFAPAVTGSKYINIRNNTATSNGGGVYYSGGTFNPTGDVRIYSNTASGNGGGIYTTGTTWTLASTVKICDKDKTVGNQAKDGGGIYVNSGTLSVSSNNVYYNKATQNGGGIYVNTGTLQITSGRLWVQANTATNNGGGIYVNTGTFKSTGSAAFTITTGNAATVNGGGIYQADGTISLLGSGWSYLGGYANNAGNSAADGGGAYLAGGTCTISPTIQIGANTASSEGGAFYIGGGSLIYNGTSMTIGNFDYSDVTTKANSAVHGGGLYISSGSATLSNATFVGNLAKRGGGICVEGGTVSVTDGTIKNHIYRADGTTKIEFGAGIYMTAGTVTLNKTSVTANETGSNACGICMNGTTAMVVNLENGASVTNNIAYGSAGGIWVNGNSTLNIKGSVVISGNKANNGSGGGIYFNSNGGIVNVSGTGNVIKGNTATGNGGGIYLNGDSETADKIVIASGGALTVGGTAAADKNTAVNGGGICMNKGTIDNAGTLNVSNNTATTNGGGIYTAASGTLNGAGAVNIYSNGAVDGAGVYISGANCSFAPTGTVQIYSNTATGNGGGIYSNKTWEMGGNIKVGCTVSSSNLGNTAKNGGGIYVAGGTLSTSGEVQVLYNTATTSGGGIYLASGTVSGGGTIKVNTNTATNGGGMYLTGGSTFTTSGNLYIQTNRGTEGGGVFLANATLAITGSSTGYIQGNKGKTSDTHEASTHGAGIYAQEGTIVLDSSKNLNVYENIGRFGPGIFFGYAGKTVTIKSTNGATGYLWPHENHDKINDKTKTGSDGSGIWIESCVVNVEHKIFINRQVYASTAENDGDSKGAIRIQRNGTNSKGILNIKNGGNLIIENCKGGDWSGGITMNAYGELHVEAGGILTITGCSTTSNGGAIKNEGGIITNAGTMTIGKANTTDKTNANSAVNGGGIYVSYDSTTKTGSLSNTGTMNVSYNTASGAGGGMYLNTSTTVSSTGGMTLNNNGATSNGGGLYMTGTDTTLTLTGTNTVHTNTAANGAGIYVNSGTFSNGTTKLSVYSNTATTDGGGIYFNSGSITVGKVEVYSNKANGGNGGGIYTKVALSMSGATIGKSGGGNTANTSGGGIYLNGVALTCTGTNDFNFNTATNGDGGGIYAGGTVSNTGTMNIKSNSATKGHGGGLYATTNVTTTTMNVGGSAAADKNSAKYGGGIFIYGGTFNAYGGTVTVQNNVATVSGGNGGGVYLNGGTLKWQDNGNNKGRWVIANNAANNKAGGLYIHTGTVTCESTNDLDIYTNSSAYGGGMYIGGRGEGGADDAKKVVTFNGAGTGIVDVFNNSVTKNGGGIMAEVCELTFSLPLTLSHNRADSTTTSDGCGGGFFLGKWVTQGVCTFNKALNVYGCTANHDGGGIYAGGSTEMTIADGVTVNVKSGKTADTAVSLSNAANSANNGGGLYLGGTFTNKGTINVENNSATTDGGGLYLTSGCSITCGSLNVFKNSAGRNGGGIHNNKAITLTSTVVVGKSGNGNTATGDGGGIYTTAALTLNNVGIKYNTASANGGGVHVTSTGSLTCSSTSIHYNTANNGGGIYSAGGNLTFATTHALKYNTANAKGGGIYMVSGTINLNAASAQLNVQENTATSGGGGVYFGGSGGTINLTSEINNGAGMDVNQNTTTGGNGGGILMENCTVNMNQRVELVHNTAPAGNGGGISIEKGTTKVQLNINAAVNIKGNSAKTNGGGLYLDNGTVAIASGITVTVNNASHDAPELESMPNSATYGGGMYLNTGSTFTNSGTLKVEYNTASTDGGGIYSKTSLSLNSNTSVKYNRAAKNGGGIYLASGGAIAENNLGNVQYNYAGVAATTELNADGTVKNYDGTGFSFTATPGGNGGGIYIGSGATATMTGGTLQNNFAYSTNQNSKGGNGGGFYIENGGTLTLKGGTIQNNSAYTSAKNSSGNNISGTGLGGGVYVQGNMNVPSGTVNITNNYAKRYGGGICQGGDSSAVSITSGATLNVHTNESGVHGGGYAIGKGTATINGTMKVYSNTANSGGGGLCMDGTGKITGSGTLNVYQNTANSGGGFYMLTYGASDANSNVVNMAGTVLITENTARSTVGGGIYLTAGSVTLSSTSKIENNTATTNGGGIYMTYSDKTSNGEVTATTTGTVILNGATISGNKAVNGGGVYIGGGKLELNSNATISDHKWKADGKTAIENGGGIYANKGTQDTIVDVKGNATIQSNQVSGKGGGIYLANGSVTVASGKTLTVGASGKANKANYGGGIYYENGTLTVSGTANVNYNEATTDGGGIYTTQNVSLTGATVSYNKAINGSGGGIFVSGAKTVTLAGTSNVNSNTAKLNGGGICMSGSGNLTISNANAVTNVNSNTAATGGGIYLSGGTVTNSGTMNVNGNTASGEGLGNGGGIFQNSGTFENTGTLNVNNNTADDTKSGTTGGKGGGVHLNSGTFKAGTMTVTGNTADIDGGGLYLKAGTFTGGTVTVSGNRATNYAGGGIYSLTSLTFTGAFTLGSSDAHNTAPKHGGGIYIKGGKLLCESTMSISYNDGGMGGGIYLDSGATLETKGTANINNNTANYSSSVSTSGNGAGVYMNGGTINNNKGTLNVHSNVADNDGGGIYYNSGTVTTSGTTAIYSNTAENYGGGIYAQAALEINGAVTVGGNAKEKGNKADHGGGIYAMNALTLTAATIRFNQATAGQGGGIYMTAGKTLTLNGTGCVDDNTASNNGGGIYLHGTGTSGATLTFGSGASYTVARNTAQGGTGGGILVYTNGTINTANATKVEINNNLAGTGGGGVYMSGATFNMAGCVTIHDNTATTDGGGIYFESGSLNVTGTPSIYTNTAKKNGGGIYANTDLTIAAGLTVGGDATAKGNKAIDGAGIYAAGTLSLTGVTVRHNQASGNGGGIYSVSGKSVTIEGTSYVNNNVANANGGGVYLDGTATLTCNGVTEINSNKTTTGDGAGVYMNSGSFEMASTAAESKIQYNIATAGSGGGVFVNTGTLTFNCKVHVSSNQALSGNGGGICINASGGKFNVNSRSFISANKANNGGGIYNVGTVATKALSMRENVATTNGGGVYNKGTFNATNETFWLGTWAVESSDAGNKATNGSGGGLYQEAGSFNVECASGSGLRMGQNRAGSNGGGMCIVGGSVNIKTGTHYIGGGFDYNGWIVGNCVAGNGGGIYLNGGALSISNTATVHIEENYAGVNGGGIYCAGSDLSLNGSNVIVKGNHAGATRDKTGTVTASTNGGNGGGIYYDASAKTLTLNNTTIESNKAWKLNGGAIYFANGTLSANTLTLKQNQAANGGGLFFANGTGTMTAVTIENNYATNGGGLYTYGGTLTFYNSFIQNHTLAVPNSTTKITYGAGIYQRVGTLILDNTKVQNNETGNNACGICMNNDGEKILTLRNGSAVLNNIANGNGAGIWAASSGTSTVNLEGPVTISGNQAKNGTGGGILTSKIVNISGNVEITGNSSSSNGGGIYQSGGTITIAENATLTVGANGKANTAVNGGGMFLNSGTFVNDGMLKVEYNTATTNGGGIYTKINLYVGSNSSITQNVAGTNTATGGNGGGIFVETNTLTLNGATLSQNYAHSILNDAGNYVEGKGGGVYMNNGTTTVTGSTISSNYATNGGGIYVRAGNLTVNGKSVIENHTLRADGSNTMLNGGGIYMADGIVKVEGSSVIRNNAVKRPGGSWNGHGGGIYQTGGSLTIQGSASITGNEASYGGGIRADAGTTTVTSATISQNHALGHGGGLFIKGGTVSLGNGAKVENNTSISNGGGIWMTNLDSTHPSQLTLTGTAKIHDNKAGANKNGTATTDGGNGGGIYLETGTLTLTGGTVSNNVANVNSGKTTGYGGGLCVDGGTVSINGTTAKAVTFTGNNACRGAAIAVKNGTLTANSSLYAHQNTAGNDAGGVLVQGSAEVTLTGSLIENNKAQWGGGAYVMGSGKLTLNGGAKMQNNTATTYGGGIYTSAGTVTISGGAAIQNNKANANGGGLYILGSAKVTVTGSSTKIDSNYAQYGGGAFIAANSSGVGGTLTLTDGATISNHELTAADASTKITNGGGVYMSAGSLTLTGASKIEGNKVGSNGGGIFMDGGTLNLTGASKIQSNAANNGAGVYCNGGTIALSTDANNQAQIRANTATTSGGGLYVNANLTLQGYLTIGATAYKDSTSYEDRNYAAGGGGVYVNAKTLTINGGVKVICNDCGGQGGGFKVINGNLTLQGGAEVSYNKVSGSSGGGTGGAIYAWGKTDDKTVYSLTILNATIQGNEALTSGGAIMAYDVNVTLGDANNTAVIKGNKALDGDGGMIYMMKYSITSNGQRVWQRPAIGVPTLKIVKATIQGNSSSNNGGAIRVQDARVEISGGTISGNTAVKNGGGIFGQNVYTHTLTTVATPVSEVVITGGSITDNIAQISGGGIYASKMNVSISGIAVTGNKAGTMANGTVSTTGGNGGGIFMTGSAQKLTLNGVELKNNVARMAPAKRANEEIESATGRGGAVAVENCDLVLTGATVIEGNRADHNGGGVHVFRTDSTASPTVKATMTGTSSKHISIKNNQAGYQGGGVYIYGAHLDANYVDVTDNQAADMGGGLLLVSYDKKNGANTGLTLSAMQAKFQNGKITGNTSGDSAGGIYIEGYQNTASVIRATTITDNTADKNGGGIYLRYTKMVLDGANTVTRNTAKAVGENSGKGGGIMIHNGSSLTVTGVTKSPIYANTAEVAGNDIFAVGATDDQLNTTLVMPETTANGAPEYWYADYFANDSKYPGQDTFPSAYKDASGKYIHLGRYNENTTPITYGRRSFGGTSTEIGAAEASTAYLALTHSTKVAYMNLTLTKVLKDANGKVETAVENTTFIFYVRGVDNAEYRLPVVIHLDKGASTGAVTINNLPLGIYDICEDESWSWRYEPSTATATGTASATFHDVADGDDFIRVTAEAGTTTAVTYNNGIENVLWLSDAEYLPFLAPVQTRSLKDGDDENEEETE